MNWTKPHDGGFHTRHHHGGLVAQAAMCQGTASFASGVTTVQENGATIIKDPVNHREINVTSNGPGVDVKVFNTLTTPPTLDMSSWGDPHDVSRNGVTTDSHGNRTFAFKDGSTLNLGTVNADGTEPKRGQGGAATFNSSAVYIPGHNPNAAAVVTHSPGQEPRGTMVAGSTGFIQSLKKEPAQAIALGDDGNFHSPDGRILTQQIQDSQDVIVGGPEALRLAARTSYGMQSDARHQSRFNQAEFQQRMHTSMMCQIANRYQNENGGLCNSLNFLYNRPDSGDHHQHRLMMAGTAYQRQLQAEQAHRYLEQESARHPGLSFDPNWGYGGTGWSTSFMGFSAMGFGYER